MNTDQIAFLDIEGYPDSKEHLFGILYERETLSTTSASHISELFKKSQPQYFCGHNFIEHDFKIAQGFSLYQYINKEKIIDTLPLSMLLYPSKKTHRLEKPYKSEIQIDNFPAADCVQTKELLLKLEDKFIHTESHLQCALFKLLKDHPLYRAFFESLQFKDTENTSVLELLSQKSHLSEQELQDIIDQYPVECGILCYQLYVSNNKNLSQIILIRFPEIPRLRKLILFDLQKTEQFIKTYSELEFGFSTFREFPSIKHGLFTVSQKNIIESAVRGESFLCVLPTGGGKTFTFQLPAIIKADICKTLTVVISPLQALMKNHTDNFNAQIKNYKSAALSGFLDPISRLNVLEELQNGMVDILYLAPEALRSNVVFNALRSRVIERFVIDEAHCFSAWGQDFRHDYFYIGQCIKELQESSHQPPISVSCFTATARPNVLDDIVKYFKDFLNLNLLLHIASSERTNLNYSAEFFSSNSEKYNQLVHHISKFHDKSIIIYRPQNARGCKQLADKLNIDERLSHYDLVIEPFYAKMDDEKDADPNRRTKNEVLNGFISNEINIVVATTAFGMGIDKPDIEAVIHYDPSDSLESYMQESGRGARSSDLKAECIVLYSEKDFKRIFLNLNRSKLQYDEIDRIAKYFKKNKKFHFQTSTRTIAKGIGIDTEDTHLDYDSLIKTAILEMEKWGIIRRGRNVTKIYATSLITVDKKDGRLPMDVVHSILDPKKELYKDHYEMLIAVMQNIIQRSKKDAIEIEALADIIGISRKEIYEIILILQKDGLIEYYNDISILIDKTLLSKLNEHFDLEEKILATMNQEIDRHKIDLRIFNSGSSEASLLKKVSSIISSWRSIGKIVQEQFSLRIHNCHCSFNLSEDSIKSLYKWMEVRKNICLIISNYCLQHEPSDLGEIEFSSNELFEIISTEYPVSLEFYHHSLVYLNENLKGFDIHRGRLIYYQGINLEKQNPIIKREIPYYKKEYKESLERYYQNKIEAVHILKEFYQNLESDGWSKQKDFVEDYFSMDYIPFKERYGFNKPYFGLAITAEGYKSILSQLNEEQSEILNDRTSKAILVLAGPGSGKTMTLVHKIASLITIENNKPDYFLMLTHSRVAAREFQNRLYSLIGPIAGTVEIYTFHAYASVIVGQIIENQKDLSDLIPKAIQLIKNGKFQPKMKTMLVLDEFQDVGENMYEFIKEIYNSMTKDRKIIAVGDDDQCIINFGSNKADPLFMNKYRTDFVSFEEEQEIPVSCYNLLKNYRSSPNIVNFTNSFAQHFKSRQKAEDLIAVSEDDGLLTLTEYSLDDMSKLTYITQLTKDILEDKSQSIAVLLRTNEEVLTIYSQLKLKGCNVQYITDRDGFSLGNIVELQDFLSVWKDSLSFISAKKYLEEHYKESINYSLTLQIIDDFSQNLSLEEMESNAAIHCCDFEELLSHISLDEYISTEGKITVSTMHKSKGREFETVYVGINGHNSKDEFDKRLFYVAMTRAKEHLHIHANKGSFSNFKDQFTDYRMINGDLPQPKQIAFSMNIGDLWLSNTNAVSGIEDSNPLPGEKIRIEKTKSGEISNFRLNKGNSIIGIMSKPSKKNSIPNCSANILAREEKGYRLSEMCEIENIVYWYDMNDHNKGYKQVLCRIVMDKK